MIEISTLIAIIGLAISVATFFIGRVTAAKKGGAQDAEMKADIKYIKLSVDKQENKLDGVVENFNDVKLEIEKLKERLRALEQKVKLLHGDSIQ